MKPTKETIIRTIVLIITFINQILTMYGKNPLPYSDKDFYNILTTVTTVSVTIWAWWKNNSLTEEAIKADKYLNELRNINKSVKGK